MAADIAALGIDQLTIAERLELIDAIWTTFPEELSQEEVPDWHLEELQKRRMEMDRTPSQGKPWREVLGQLEN